LFLETAIRCNSHSALACRRLPLGIALSCLSLAVFSPNYAQAQSSNANAYASKGQTAAAQEEDNAAGSQKRENAFHDKRATVGGEAIGDAARGAFTGAAIGAIAGDAGKGPAFGAAAVAAHGRASNHTKRRRLLLAEAHAGEV
jgi:hypothetical protein